MRTLTWVFSVLAGIAVLAQTPPRLPDYPLQFAGFSARFQPDGSFTLDGAGWPSFRGTWKPVDGAIELLTPDAPGGCDQPGRYRAVTRDTRTTLDVVSDECRPRRMILDRSTWLPAGESEPIPERNTQRTL